MNVIDICKLAPVIPVLTVEEPEVSVPLAKVLLEGGLPAIEVTLRTPKALEVIRAMSRIEGAVVGAGTLLSSKDVWSAKEAGAKFG
ncbi:MAG TPA: keto-deoxy-phosphogluconate aldolase, partial [Alphaproteobacteria bacterium]|nr:keto-deoxy-phosphogluconate aldolase [Alphaproteobacteria bacterium]